MTKLKEQLLTAPRPAVLRFLSSAIHELTLCGRDAYGGHNAETRLTAVNEALHRASGHLRDLCDNSTPLTEARALGIVEATVLIAPTAMDRLLRYLL